MQIYPAIDLLNGKCVRLYQGKFERETIYHDDPFEIAKQYLDEGATWMHVVDLDGAKDVAKNQQSLVIELAQKTDLNIQAGGGIRSEEQIKTLLESGVSRVIIGSQAVREPAKVSKWIQSFGNEKIVLALDVKYAEDDKPYVAMEGWQQITDMMLFDLVEGYLESGLKHVICTDIDRDGTLIGPNAGLYLEFFERFPEIQVQASGGISSLSDLAVLRDLHASGVVIGRALYEKRFTLREAIDHVS